jgi:general secretion pathway protein A
MYEEYFRLTATPFSIAPDPRFLYMSGRHREAIAHLLYGVRGEGGFVLLTGEIGTGKTTLCRCLLDQIHDQCDVAFILNPKMGVRELLATICQEFHIDMPAAGSGVKMFVDAINSHLLRANAAGRRAVLIIDEAQNLQPQVLELLRLLTNLETNTRKLLQIILIGQPELQEMLARPEMRQVAQRIVARFHLTHLRKDEVAAYVKHRLRVSGTLLPLIPDNLTDRLYRLTGGVPRLINLVCDRALLGAYVQGRRQATRQNLKQAAREVFGVSAGRALGRRLAWGLSILGATCGLAVAAYVTPFRWPVAPSLPAPPQAAAVPAEAEAVPPPKPAAVSPAPAPAAAKRSDDALVMAASLGWREGLPPREQSERLAFRDLFKRYGFAYDAGSSPAPCKAAVAAGMRCLSGRGGLADLERFNQPAVLTLEGPGGRYYGVLTALDGQSATFDLAGEMRRVSLAAMAQAWSGDYVLVWKPPAGIRDALPPGSHGAAVAWLRKSLAEVTGEAAGGPPAFDAELAGRVRAFQLSEGLVPDGVVGALTLVHLNLRLDKALPCLSLDGNSGQDVLHP